MCGVEMAFRALQNQRRRATVHCVQTHETLFLPDLAELVLEHETGAEIAEVPAERVRDVYFSLYHQHVPVLEDAGLVWYEQAEDHVGVTDQASGILVRARDCIDELVNSRSSV